VPISINSAHATSSERIGGVGGITPYTKTCLPGKQITGVNIVNSAVIDTIKFRCTSISSSGKWQGEHFWGSYTHSDAPQQSTQSKTALCPADMFVRGVSGSIASSAGNNTVLQGISISCHNSDSSGHATGSPVTKTVQASSGPWSNWKYCPNNSLALGASGKSGWYLDNLKLNCGTLASVSNNQSSGSQSA